MNNCVVYLAATGREEELNQSLGLIYKNFLPTNPCSVIVYHESDFDKNKIKFNVQFNLVNLSIPDYSQEILDKIPVKFREGFYDEKTIGYRSMCRFFAGEFYRRIADFDYYLRLDSDSFILDPVIYNLFQKISEGNFQYGYLQNSIFSDEPWVIEGLYALVGNWIKECKIPVLKPISEIPEGFAYYNNFEVGCVNWFLTSRYLDMYRVVEKTGNIYQKRWGDAPIRGLGTQLFMEDQHKLAITGIHYRHGYLPHCFETNIDGSYSGQFRRV